MKNNKYGINSLKRDFPTDEACLNFLFDNLHSRKCSCGGKYSLIKGRRQFQCSKCRFQIAPASGTIFDHSSTSLTLWFHALMVFSNAKSGISAKQIQRELEVTYKTAWRMLNLIRKALSSKGKKLKGDVESDTAYFGGRYRSGKYNEKQKQAIAAKSVIIGAVERGGNFKAQVIPDLKKEVITKFITENVQKSGTRLLTDMSRNYDSVAKGFDRYAVDHHRNEYVRGDIHVNNVERFWGHVKKSVKGVHKVISKKYLQAYLDGFVFHYNNRHSDKARFEALLGALLSS